MPLHVFHHHNVTICICLVLQIYSYLFLFSNLNPEWVWPLPECFFSLLSAVIFVCTYLWHILMNLFVSICTGFRFPWKSSQNFSSFISKHGSFEQNMFYLFFHLWMEWIGQNNFSLYIYIYKVTKHALYQIIQIMNDHYIQIIFHVTI